MDAFINSLLFENYYLNIWISISIIIWTLILMLIAYEIMDYYIVSKEINFNKKNNNEYNTFKNKVIVKFKYYFSMIIGAFIGIILGYIMAFLILPFILVIIFIIKYYQRKPDDIENPNLEEGHFVILF